MLFYFLQLLVLSLMIGLAFYAKMKYFSDPLPLENGGSAEKAINSKSGVSDQSRRGLSKYRSSKGNQRTIQGLECPGTVVVTEKQKHREFTAFVVTAHNADCICVSKLLLSIIELVLFCLQIMTIFGIHNAATHCLWIIVLQLSIYFLYQFFISRSLHNIYDSNPASYFLVL